MPLQHLNHEQYAAASASMGHNLIIASAGTGKTSTIVGRIAYLLQQGVKAQEILLLTFTNKAAQEMIARVEQKFGAVAREIECGTFHAVCYRFLKTQHNITLKQPKELKILFKSIAKSRVYPQDITSKPYTGEYLFELYSLFLNTREEEGLEEWLISRGHGEHALYAEIYEGIFEEYCALKQEHNYMDYNDLLITYAQEMCLKPCPYAEILCDEYQDTNPLQHRVIKALNPKSLFCVGDYDQSIYAFNGADISIISRFTEVHHHARVFSLKKNYRSTRYILDLANRVIAHNERIYPKELEVVNTSTPIAPTLLVYDELFAQYQGVAQKILTANYPLHDIAIIFRNNASADGCEARLRELNIPSRRKGGVSFFDVKEVALMLNLCSVLHNPTDMMAYIHILSYGGGIGDFIARELYEGLLRVGHGNALRGMIMPADVQAFVRRAKNAQLGLFDDVFTLQDVGKFDDVIEGDFLRHPILAHPKLSADGARFLSDFYTLLKGYKEGARVCDVIAYLAQSKLYQHIIDMLCKQRAKRKDGSIDNERKAQAYDSIKRKIILLQDIAKQYENLGRFLNALVLSSAENTQGKGVNLLTIHASKGLEFGMVFIIDLMQGRFPNMKLMARSGGSIEEERRLLYVAITRAKEVLYLSYAQQDSIKAMRYEPSVFLHEAGLL